MSILEELTKANVSVFYSELSRQNEKIKFMNIL